MSKQDVSCARHFRHISFETYFPIKSKCDDEHRTVDIGATRMGIVIRPHTRAPIPSATSLRWSVNGDWVIDQFLAINSIWTERPTRRSYRHTRTLQVVCIVPLSLSICHTCPCIQITSHLSAASISNSLVCSAMMAVVSATAATGMS